MLLNYIPNLLVAIPLLLYCVVALLDPASVDPAHAVLLAFSMGLLTLIDGVLDAADKRSKRKAARQRAQAQQRRQAYYQAVVDQRIAELQGMGRPPRDPRLN